MVRPVTIGGKHLLSMRGGMNESRTASQQHVIWVPKMRPYASMNVLPSACNIVLTDMHACNGHSNIPELHDDLGVVPWWQ